MAIYQAKQGEGNQAQVLRNPALFLSLCLSPHLTYWESPNVFDYGTP